MESAYLYVRVSTDEQKRKGYSLPEQEDLLKYCEFNDSKSKASTAKIFQLKISIALNGKN
jgi:site-specific DNA recombinase